MRREKIILRCEYPVCVYIWEGELERECLCCQKIEGAAKKIRVNRIFVAV